MTPVEIGSAVGAGLLLVGSAYAYLHKHRPALVGVGDRRAPAPSPTPPPAAVNPPINVQELAIDLALVKNEVRHLKRGQRRQNRKLDAILARLPEVEA